MGSIKVCPRCGGTLEAVSERTGGFSGTKAVVGAVIAGPVGVAAGALGKKLVTLQCTGCGYTLETKEKDANEIAEHNRALAEYEAQAQAKNTIQVTQSPYADIVTFGREDPPYTLSVPNYLPPLLSGEGWANQRRQNRALAAGKEHVAALKADGTVVAAGENEDGRCDVQDWTDVVEVHATNSVTCGLRKDGTVLFAGKRTGLEVVENWKNVRLLACSNKTSSLKEIIAGVTQDGQILLAGAKREEKGKAADGADVASLLEKRMTDNTRRNIANAVELSICEANLLALQADGRVHGMGVDNDGSFYDAIKWENIAALHQGHGCAFGLRNDGTVFRAGMYHPSGQLAESLILLEKTMFLSNEYPVLMELSMFDNDVISMQGDCFLRADGSVVSRFGGNLQKQEVNYLDPETWHDMVAATHISSSSQTIGIRSDGRAVLKAKEGLYDAARDWDNLYVVPGHREYVLRRIMEREEEVRQFWEGEETKRVQAERRKQGLCQHCGGKFSLFGRTCKACGKPKDY